MSPLLLTSGRLAALIGSLRPGIEALLAQYDRKHLHVVVLLANPGGHNVEFNNSLAGSVEDYPAGKPFNQNATLKAELSLRTQMDTIDVLTKAPHLLKENDFLYPGGVYFQGGAVGVSGAHAPMDHAIARFIAEIIIAACRIQVEEFHKLVAAGKAPPRLSSVFTASTAS